MTTIALDNRPFEATHRAGYAEFAGTSRLLRLYLRRDRIVLPLWTILLGLMPGPVYVGSVKNLYTTPEQLDSLARSTAASPALIAMYGPVFSSTLGSIGLWKAGAMYTIIAIAAILTVIRHTRVEEETGRADLLGSTRVGRHAGLTAALLLTGLGSVVTGGLATITLLGTGRAGAVAFGASMALSGLVWAGVAAIAAQVSTSARIARQVALGVLAVAFVLRAVGDVGSGTLSWFSPLGWCLQIRPYAQERWWVLLPLLAAAALATTTAFSLLRRRDVGAGILADRLGRPVAPASLSSPLGLAWRLQRSALVVWTVALALYGMLFGGATHGLGKMIGDNKLFHDLLARMAGGARTLEEQFLGYALSMVAFGAAAYAISALLRLYEEETQGRAEATLAASVGRVRFALSHLLFALFGPAVAILASGVGAGVVYGAATHNIGHELPAVLAGAALQIPAIWVVTGITLLLYGAAPKYTPMAWGVFSGMIVVYLVGSLGDLPQWLLDLVPFVHSPKLPGGHFQVAPVLWLLAAAAALLAVGLATFRRRDLRQ